MTSPYDRSQSRRGGWGHWLPLAATVTVAAAGLAAWVWSQRKDQEVAAADDADTAVYQDLDYENADYGDNPPYGATGIKQAKPSSHAGLGPEHVTDRTVAAAAAAALDPPSWGAQMSGALRRTPSPQQLMDGARKTVLAGMTAVGSALSAIREEDKTAYADHDTWSEEADAKKERPGASSGHAGMRKRTVAVVVSADAHPHTTEPDGFHEHASILSHIPSRIEHSKIKVYILIYAPYLKDSTSDVLGHLPPASISSSFSDIDHSEAQMAGEKTKSAVSSADPVFDSIYSQASALVEKESMVLPFTTPNGHMHLLRHLQPELIYLPESLAGEEGSLVETLQTWLRHDVILVVGADDGHGGLADSESEAEKPPSGVEKWWQRGDRVGRGRGVVVVDGMRVHDDWTRRVEGRE